MKVIMINVTATGSTGGVVDSVCKALLAKGDQGLLLYGRGSELKDAVKISSGAECAMDAALSRLTGYNGVFSKRATQRAISIIEDQKPDVVHIHNIHGYYINLYELVEYLKKENIPTVWTLHDEYLYTGRCGISNACEEWIHGCRSCPHKKEYPSTLLFDYANVMWNKKKNLFEDWENVHFATPSLWLCERAKKSFLGGHYFEVISNGVDTNVFYADEKAEKHKQTVLFVAPNALAEHKGGRILLKIAKCPEFSDIEFVIIGATQREADQYTRGNVKVLERTQDKNALAGYYRSATVFVTLSKRETFSMTCAESVCCGTPVVGFEAGAPETIFKKPYAEFVRYGDIEALSNFLAARLQTETDRHACAEYGKNNFSVGVMNKKYIDLYEKLCK